MTDTVESVLAEMRKVAPRGWAHIHGADIEDWATRLAAAHAREMGEADAARNAMFIRAREWAELSGKAEARAEAAEALLREAVEWNWLDDDAPAELHARIDTHLGAPR